jgi:threonine synthase
MTSEVSAWKNPRWQRLVCFDCGREHSLDRLQTVCTTCGMPLGVDYDLTAPAFSPAVLAAGPASLWRYRELLPVAAGREVTLAEGWTPLLEVERGALVKDEARNPTGSFKARGMSVAVSIARALGARALRAPSAGNAAGALAAYGAAAGLAVTVAMPQDTPPIFVEECRFYGAEVELVPGTIAEAGKWLREHGPAEAFDMSTLREPHRLEGKKTMGFEIWEQLGGQLPDVVVYPTGGGTGLVGMWKAWQELAALGLLAAAARPPRMVSVQVEGCAPVVRAFESGAERTVPFPEPRTRAWGLRVPSPLGGFLCLRAIRETRGTAVAVSEAAMAEATGELGRRSGLDICPEGGAAWAVFRQLRERGWIRPEERVVIFNTGTGLKYR